jgi:hypothetical protein
LQSSIATMHGATRSSYFRLQPLIIGNVPIMVSATDHVLNACWKEERKEMPEPRRREKTALRRENCSPAHVFKTLDDNAARRTGFRGEVVLYIVHAGSFLGQLSAFCYIRLVSLQKNSRREEKFRCMFNPSLKKPRVGYLARK